MITRVLNLQNLALRQIAVPMAKAVSATARTPVVTPVTAVADPLGAEDRGGEGVFGDFGAQLHHRIEGAVEVEVALERHDARDGALALVRVLTLEGLFAKDEDVFVRVTQRRIGRGLP